jgi:energy-coupling factor transport system permease protein
MTLTLYVPAATVLHRLHPVTKVGLLVALIVSAFVVDRPLLLLPLALGVGTLLILAGGLPNLRRFAPVLLVVLVFTVSIWTVFYGRALAPSRAGFAYGLSMAIRLDTFLVTGLLFLTTTRVEEVAYALGRLRVPYVVGFTLTLSFRLVPVFFDAAVTIVQAQRCRGLDLRRGSLVARLRHFVPVIVPVFMGALRRADRMAMALELRGFNSGRPRTTFLRAAAGRADFVAAAIALGTVSLYLALWRAGAGALGTFE